MKLTSFLAAAAIAATPILTPQVNAANIFSDDFESYADTTAMQAVWGSTGLGTLDAAFGNPGQSMAHPGGEDNIVTIPVQTATAAAPLIYTADIYDDGTGTGKRLTAGLRSSTVANIIEMGMYNDPIHYAVRAVLPGPNWAAFSNITDDSGNPIDNAPVEGWHRFQAVLDGSNVTFTLDLGSTGIINATEVLEASFHGDGVDSIRLGGPSSLSSGGGGGFFDNVSLDSGVIPEPTTFALAGLALFGLAGAGRRR